jgi:hypothetical protein
MTSLPLLRPFLPFEMPPHPHPLESLVILDESVLTSLVRLYLICTCKEPSLALAELRDTQNAVNERGDRKVMDNPSRIDIWLV